MRTGAAPQWLYTQMPSDLAMKQTKPHSKHDLQGEGGGKTLLNTPVHRARACQCHR